MAGAKVRPRLIRHATCGAAITVKRVNKNPGDLNESVLWCDQCDRELTYESLTPPITSTVCVVLARDAGQFD